jgi:hypothetical protein
MEEVTSVDADTINKIINKLNHPLSVGDAILDIEKIINIKQTLLWRAEAGTCCGSLGNIASSLSNEIILLEKSLTALQKGDKLETIRTLQEYNQSFSSVNTTGKHDSCK